MDKLDLMKIKHFCASKDTIMKMEKPHIARKYLQTMFDKKLISRIHKLLLQVNNNKKTVKNVDKRFE